MKEGQESIFYLCGESVEKLQRNPHLEGFKAKNIEVLLLTDTVDDFWPSSLSEFDGKPFKSVTRAGRRSGQSRGRRRKRTRRMTNLRAEAGDLPTLSRLMKLTLGDAVKDVRAPERLTDSPVCLTWRTKTIWIFIWNVS